MGTPEVTRRELSRRGFLRIAGEAGLGALAVSLGSAGVARAGRGPAREIRLEARELTWELAPGRTIKAMAYNGRIPGPEIRVKEGERVRVVLTNALAEPTTIHWHGVDVPNPMDGVPGVTQKRVEPGETFVYTAHNPGDWFLHCHKPMHMEGGMITLAQIG